MVYTEMKKEDFHLAIHLFILLFSSYLCSDISDTAFGSVRYGLPAAFGDFNSDELTDLFVIHKNGSASSSVEILLGSTNKPFFGSDPNNKLKCFFPNFMVVSIVPGDFDGDALMDMLIVAKRTGSSGYDYDIFVAWGNITSLSCPNNTDTDSIIRLIDEPLAIDYFKNMSTDLFGTNLNGSRVLWLFDKDRSKKPREVPLLPTNEKLGSLRVPHSHAFVDFNDDNWPDLCLTSETGFEVWLWDNENLNFRYDPSRKIPPLAVAGEVGQTLFMDLETSNQLNQIVPVFSKSKSSIFAYFDNKWVDLKVNFEQEPGKLWMFEAKKELDTVTLRAGDFNNDGFVDMLATLTLSNTDKRNVFLFENVPCPGNCEFNRTFEIKWNALGTEPDGVYMATFYDFLQDGILDIIFVSKSNEKHVMSAFKNDLDYDANFIKVMVITGLKNKKIELPSTPLGTKRHIFGTNLPGPKIRYKTTNQEGKSQTGVSVQLPQSAHLALHLPYTIFGLGRTPNFIEDLTIGVFNQSRTWNQIIPNSQLIVIPYPQDEPNSWRAQLFVTPSKIVLQTVIALTGTCIIIGFIIAILHWKERREDRIERLQEAHRFHFDAM